MGRPKGSKNKPKINKEKERAEVYQHTTEDFTMQKKIIKGQKIPAKAGKNMWKDDGSIPEEEFDKLVSRRPATQPRPAATMREITCSCCKKTVKIPSSLETSQYYRCEKCVGN